MSLHYLATPYQHYKQRVRGGAGAFDLIDLIKGGASAAVDCFQRFHKHPLRIIRTATYCLP
jgi:hypothetical protein